jgi:TonB family protein
VATACAEGQSCAREALQEALQPDPNMSSSFGSGDLSTGLDDHDIYGGLVGDADGAAGSFGGGGTGTGTGGVGTIGLGTGGSGTGRFGGSRRDTSVTSTQLTSHGQLDKAIIRRIVRQSLSRIRYCYEKELVKDPTLAGTVTVTFTIDQRGSVATASASGMPVVDACVASAVRSLVFPKPSGGGVVNVTYPFTFASAH